MEKDYYYNENLDDFSNKISELNIKDEEYKYKNKNNINYDENSINQIHSNKNINLENYYNNLNDKECSHNYDNYKYNRKISKSSEKKKIDWSFSFS